MRSPETVSRYAADQFCRVGACENTVDDPQYFFAVAAGVNFDQLFYLNFLFLYVILNFFLLGSTSLVIEFVYPFMLIGKCGTRQW